MDRRTFIKRSVFTGGALGLAGAGYLGVRGSATLPEPVRPLHVLDALSFGVLVKLAEPIVPQPGVDHREIAHRIDGSLRYVSPEAQDDLRLVLAVLENSLSGLFTRGSVTLFSELTREGRAEAIRRWGDSSVEMLRGATGSLRKLVLGVHYAPLENAKAVGYPGPPFEVPDPGPLAPRAPLSKPWTPEVTTPSGEAKTGIATSARADGSEE